MIAGHATAEGTARYRARFAKLRDAGFFRHPENVAQAGELWLSSLGLGTYLGEADGAGDAAYTEAIKTALSSGINVLDTAINYRHQRSERNIGSALLALIQAEQLRRDEVLVCTKAGYLPFDAVVPADPRAYFTAEYIDTGLLAATDIAGGMHSMAPKYLANQIERSRKNLGLETLDVFYVHNPESQLGYVNEDVFWSRVRVAFQALEQMVEQGAIRFYGAATWNGFRVPPGDRAYLNLERMVKMAEDAGGKEHHFRFVQLPMNLAMTEAYGLGNHAYRGERGSVLSLADSFGTAVVASATLYQGQLTTGLPDPLKHALGTETDVETAIQFTRSAPGITTALVGMSNKGHVLTNVSAMMRAPVPAEMWEGLFSTPE